MHCFCGSLLHFTAHLYACVCVQARVCMCVCVRVSSERPHCLPAGGAGADVTVRDRKMAAGVRHLSRWAGGVHVGDPGGAGGVSDPGSVSGMPDGPYTRAEGPGSGRCDPSAWGLHSDRHRLQCLLPDGQFRRDTETTAFLTHSPSSLTQCICACVCVCVCVHICLCVFVCVYECVHLCVCLCV